MTEEEKQVKIKEHDRLQKMLLYSKYKAEGDKPRAAWIKAGFTPEEFTFANYAEGGKDTWFKKGQPPPTAKRSTIYCWFAKYMDLSDEDLEDMDKDRLNGNQKAALEIIYKVRDGHWQAMRHMLDRELGRPRQEVNIRTDEELKIVGSPFAINNSK